MSAIYPYSKDFVVTYADRWTVYRYDDRFRCLAARKSRGNHAAIDELRKWVASPDKIDYTVVNSAAKALDTVTRNWKVVVEESTLYKRPEPDHLISQSIPSDIGSGSHNNNLRLVLTLSIWTRR